MSSVVKQMFKVRECRDGYGRLINVHGFHGTFKTWVTEKTDVDWLTGEVVLAHKVGNNLSAAYQQDDELEKRRYLMQMYSDLLLSS